MRHLGRLFHSMTSGIFHSPSGKAHIYTKLAIILPLLLLPPTGILSNSSTPPKSKLHLIAAMNIDRPGRTIRLPWHRRKDNIPDENETMVSRRVPLISMLPLAAKNHFVAMSGEFTGTFLFLLFALGGTNVVNAAPEQGQPADLAANPAKLLFIALCFGFSLAVNAWMFFRISGGLFNPAVRSLYFLTPWH